MRPAGSSTGRRTPDAEIEGRDEMSTFLLYLGIAAAVIVLFNVLLIAFVFVRHHLHDRTNGQPY
jgi:hypothetical protein